MKKVGILTFHRAQNYGAVLQALALQEVLSRFKCKAQIIDYYNPAVYDQYKPFAVLSNNPLKRLKRFMGDVLFYHDSQLRVSRFTDFIQAYLNLTRSVMRAEDLSDLKLDILIAGSDQIWNYDITGGMDQLYTLDFETSAKKISYAASIGSSALVTRSPKFFKFLDGLDNISVRESQTQKALNKMTQKDIDVVLDPVLLLGQKEWSALLKTSPIINKKYIFAYSPGSGSKQYYQAINRAARLTGMEVVYFERENPFSYLHCKRKSWYSAGPKEFVQLLANAEYVITTSFHGLALALVYNKNFSVVLDHGAERLTTLLREVNLEMRILEDTADIGRHMDDPIDWAATNAALARERCKSLVWLEGVLDS